MGAPRIGLLTALAAALLALPASGQVLITEFMASNAGSLLDEDGDAPDWIELHNPGPASVNLEGWFLTDAPAQLTRWRFPATNLPPGGYLVVFASGKNRAVSGQPLHTSFALDAGGGYLALVQPDGISIASEFAAYPPQWPDVSHGLGLGPSREASFLLGPNAPMRYLIPTAPVSEAWRGGAAFDDMAWAAGILAAGYDENPGPVTVAYSVETNTPGNQAYGGALGLDFDVQQPALVTELGCFDDSGNGIAGGVTITVQLWARNNGGTPDNPGDDTGRAVLMTTSFTSTQPGALLGGHRFKPLAQPLTLTNGSYTIVAYGYGAAERLANLSLGAFAGARPDSGGGVLRFVGRSRYGTAGTFPSTVDVNVAQYGAGSFKFQALPRSDFGTTLAAMRQSNASALLRVPFELPGQADYSQLLLNVEYNDGFAAWLNGVEIARRHAPDSLAFDSAATSVANAAESIDVTTFAGALIPGANLLAIQGLNVGADDGDFRIDATLTAELYATQAVHFLLPTPGTANGAGLLSPRVVINEIHSDPVRSKIDPLEFVELYNPLPVAVDVSGWSFARGLTYLFPPGTTIGPRGYLLVAEAPDALEQQLGARSLGPWTGALANEGETVELVDANGVLVDRVDYRLGFPWPTVGDNGYSMQLIHEGLDRELGGSWRSGPPTPGTRNAATAGKAPPQIRQVDHSPGQPRTGESVAITAKVTDPDGVEAVWLEYQVVDPGSYITLDDPHFATNWTTLPMRDDGLEGDTAPSDSVFTAELPADLQQHRRLVRYRLRAADRLGSAVRVPYDDDPSANFAYFVYDGVPPWTGAVRPGVTMPRTFGTNTMGKVRAFHLISRSNDVYNCQYNAAYNDGQYRFEGALVAEGKVYDHIHYRAKGQNSTFATGKNKWKWRFNRGRWFEMTDDYGRPLETRRETINITALKEPWAVWNVGLAGLDEAVIFRLANLAGSPSPKSCYFQLRVIDGAAESSPASQYEGDFWGLYLAFEEHDEQFKDEHRLPDGNLVRMQVTAGNNHLKAQGSGQPGDLSDLNAFVSGTTGYNATPTQPEAWWRANVNLPEYFAWRTVVEAVNHTDIRDQENVAYFRDPATGQWSILNWDCDLLYEQFDRWGPEGTQTTSPFEQIRRCLEIPAIRLEFQNRARELQDLLLNSDQAWKLVDEFVSLITDGGVGDPGFVEVDRRRWDYNPINPVPPRGAGAFGNYYRTPYPIPNMGRGPYPQPFYRVLASADFAAQVAWVKNFIAFDPHGGARLAALVEDPTIPATPTLTYIGDPGFAADGLAFRCGEFSSPAGRAFAAMQWRVGEVSDPSVPNFLQGAPWRYEIEPVWDSGELSTFNPEITLPPAFLREGRSYRLRVKFKDDDGRWSHWSDPVQFMAGAPAVVRLARDLVVTEIMYNPPAFGEVSGSEFEFLELKNVGTTLLDLSGLTFTSGINFTFPPGSQLAPGQTFLLARDPARLAGKYPGVTVDGVYSGRLDNAGETIELSHPVGGRIFSFAYGTGAPWPVTPDNFGFSLVAANPNAPFDLDDPANWRASSLPGGSPGTDDPANLVPTIRISEVLSASAPPETDWIELFNPDASIVEIGGWFLTDDRAEPMKFRIPDGTTLAPLGYVIFAETNFNPAPGTTGNFALSARGDEVYLFSGDAQTNLTGYSHGFRFEAAPDGVTFGRHLVSTGEEHFPAQLTATPGQPNSGPRVGPIIFTEIHYHPVPGGDEFLELKNVAATNVPLYDPAFQTNTWQVNGVGYTFPPLIELAPDQRLLLVAANPSTFRARYSVPASVQILGPYPGQLQDGGERLELLRPQTPDTNGVALITVDEVRYNDKTPWAFAADGSGASLQRKADSAYGNDPASWEAANPTPGSEFIGGEAPVIYAQPQSQATLIGQTALFTVTAAGAPPLRYQWAFNGRAIPEATSGNLLLTGVLSSQAGNYSVIVFNDAGSAASAIAHLTVATPLIILAQPSDQLVNPGEPATFRVVAAGSGALGYQWRKDGADLPGQTGSTLTVSDAQVEDVGTYSCVVTDNTGPVISAPARLVVLIQPVITLNPASQAVVPGAAVVLSVSVTNTASLPIGYRWRRNKQNFPNNHFVLDERTCFLTITNAQPPYTDYGVVVTNVARMSGFLSQSAILDFRPDTDGDGLPDDWETAFGLGPANPDDAALDSDGDRMSNWEEYVAGTNPTDPDSYLRVEAAPANSPASVSFSAVSNRTYTVQYTDALASGPWFKLADLPAQITNRVWTLPDPAYGASRFYRVATPQRP